MQHGVDRIHCLEFSASPAEAFMYMELEEIKETKKESETRKKEN
jgi:hypothetical protein